MSLDRSLKSSGTLNQHRNVLTRAERIAKLTEDKDFDPATSDPVGLRKVANRKIVTGKKSSKKTDDDADAK